MLKNLNYQTFYDSAEQETAEATLSRVVLRRFNQNQRIIQQLFPDYAENIIAQTLAEYSPIVTRTKHINISNIARGRTLYHINPDKQVTKQVACFQQRAPMISHSCSSSAPIELVPETLGTINSLYPGLSSKLAPLSEDADSLVVLGCGLGLHIEKLLQLKDWKRILLVEPSWELMHSSLFVANWASIHRRLVQSGIQLELIAGLEGAANNRAIERWMADNAPSAYLFRHYHYAPFNQLEQQTVIHGISVQECAQQRITLNDDDLSFECELPLWSYLLDEEQSDELNSSQKECFARRKANLASMKQAFPDIVSEFEHYEAKRWLPFLMVSGELNLLDVETGSVLYQDSPRQETEQYFEFYSRSPRMDTLDARYTLRKPSPFLHYEYSDKLRELVLALPEVSISLPEKIPSFIMYGGGIGIQVERLLLDHSVDNFILYEPNWDFFSASLMVADWSQVLEKAKQQESRLYLNIGDDGSNMYADIHRRLLSTGINILSYTYFFVSYHTQQMHASINDTREQLKILLNISEYYDHSFFNITHTTEALRQGHCLMLEDKPESIRRELAETPVFIVGNGPSLDKSIEVLREHREKAIIISCGTSLKALYEFGIQPDFHAEVEQTNATSLWINQVPDKQWLKEISLLSVCGVHPNVVSLFKDAYLGLKSGEASTVCYSQISPEFANLQWIYYSFPTVSNCTLSTVIKLGFKQVYLFGVDLGFVDPKFHHSQQSAYYKKGGEELYDYSRHGVGFRVKGNFEDQVFTKQEFKLSAEIIGRSLAEVSGVECFNTSNGAFIEGTYPLKLESVLLVNGVIDKNGFKKRLKEQAYSSNLQSVAESFDLHFRKEDYEADHQTIRALWNEPCESWESVLELMDEHNHQVKETTRGKHSLYFYLMRGSSAFTLSYLTRLAFSSDDEEECMKRFEQGAKVWRDYMDDARDFYMEHWGEFDKTNAPLAGTSF
ncbi:6-hydroxymethylpterin diphosphokinase MptE-like protein [Aliagarivorans taiwanensis]|uniref:motility associated factor glycosyltransferase family protein n=1 Tax=Aliagarivorans taiwanensis TaxID=561966 RepID=UPI00042357BB|nr:6-hydroxymethylpterin diphosphokinase MptE-like protein [Aliagarivorans taiwanensis]